jgi:hypothetical protein
VVLPMRQLGECWCCCLPLMVDDAEEVIHPDPACWMWHNRIRVSEGEHRVLESDAVIVGDVPASAVIVTQGHRLLVIGKVLGNVR